MFYDLLINEVLYLDISSEINGFATPKKIIFYVENYNNLNERVKPQRFDFLTVACCC